jgi:hypothetical protein
MTASGPGRHVSADDHFLKQKHDAELQRLRQKQQDEWLALLEFQRRERDPLWGQPQAHPTFGGHQLTPRLTPAQTEIIRPTTETDVIHLSSDDDESSTSQTPWFSARQPKAQTTSRKKSLPCKTCREEPAVGSSGKSPKPHPAHYSKSAQHAIEQGHGEGEGEQQVINSCNPVTGHHTKEYVDIGSKRRQSISKTNNILGQIPKELGKVRAKPVQLTDKSRPTTGTSVNTKPTKTSGSPVPPRFRFQKPPLDRDSSPEIPLALLRKQQNDRSAILKDPKKVARNPQLLTLQQKKKYGLFGNDILHNNRGESWASGLGSAFLAPAQQVPLVKVQSSSDNEKKNLSVKIKCRPERLKAIAQNAISKSRQRAIIADQAQRAAASETVTGVSSNHAQPERLKYRKTATQDPTCLSSHASSSTTPDRASTIAETGTASPSNVSPNTASQFTSSRDALAYIRERRECPSSVASIFSTFSPMASVSTLRKRKNVETLSDDSDFAPSEPPSPADKMKIAAPKPNVATKKANVKNGHNFKVPQTPQAKAGSKSMLTTPGAPVTKKQKVIPKTPETPTRAASTLPSRKSNMFPLTGSHSGGRTQVSSSVRPMRGAAAQAYQKLQDLAENVKDSNVEEAKFIAEKEEWNYPILQKQSKKQMEAIKKRFRSMSMTPTPSRAQESEDEDDDARARGTKNWTSERLGGDRYIAKGKEAEMSPEYDSLSEGTVSQYKWVDGVIVQVDGGDQEMEDV